MKHVKDILILLISVINVQLVSSQTLAFPGAEGAGKFTEGGRGGDVYHVTNLEDVGPGTLRWGIQSIRGPRTIVFDVAGTIRLKSELMIRDVSHLTIAGQTAPGKGITIADHPIRIHHSKHIVVRYLRIRIGDENKPAGSGPDAIEANYDENIILDHLSLSWGIDGNGDFRGLKNATLQWNIFSEALNNSLHKKGSHAMCSSFRNPEGPSTLHHNIYASSRNRHPTINGGPEVMEFCNNVDYNWQNAHNLDGDQLNLMGNYYKAGPSMDAAKKPVQFKSGKEPATAKGYFSGNYFDGLPEAYNQDNYAAMDYNASGLGFGAVANYKNTTREDFEVSERFDAGIYKLAEIQSAKEAYESCLKHSGCSLVRDEVDERFIKSIIDNTGRIIDSQSEVGGWDIYPPISRPNNWDLDQDGMPDQWEVDMGLDPKDGGDGNCDLNQDGFTNLEAYLNGILEN
jgi:pectate lyase